MKKSILLSLLSLFISLSLNAQKTPPAAVLTAFAQQFPGITAPEWDKENRHEWEAEFKQNGKDMSANFSTDGKLLETEMEVSVSELPAAVQTALKGKKVKEAARIQRANGTTVYEAEVGHKDLLFDAAGMRVK